MEIKDRSTETSQTDKQREIIFKNLEYQRPLGQYQKV